MVQHCQPHGYPAVGIWHEEVDNASWWKQYLHGIEGSSSYLIIIYVTIKQYWSITIMHSIYKLHHIFKHKQLFKYWLRRDYYRYYTWTIYFYITSWILTTTPQWVGPCWQKVLSSRRCHRYLVLCEESHSTGHHVVLQVVTNWKVGDYRDLHVEVKINGYCLDS